MSLVDFITKLQKQPKYIKTQIKWLGVAVFMVILLSCWLWSLSNAFSSRQSDKEQTDKGLDGLGQLKEDIPSLWQSLGAGIGSVVDTVQGDLNTISSPSPTASPDGSSSDRLPID